MAYLNELSPWERKREYYNNIRIKMDIEDQTNVIKRQRKEIAASHFENSNRIIISQERINEHIKNGFTDISNQISEINYGIDDLKAAFEWGMAELVWQMEQTNYTLRSIEKAVWSPFDVSARNRKEQAMEAYKYGWMDISEEYFLESEKIVKTDFTVHISLGLIYLFHHIDKHKALTYFEKAIKYARPKSNYYTSYALLHKALIHFDLDDLENAIISVLEAIDLSPSLSEAYYQISQYYAQSQQVDKCTDNLYIAIKSDYNYCFKAEKDSLFDPVRENIDALFEKIRTEEEQRAQETISKLKVKHENSISVAKEYCDQKLPESYIFNNEIESMNNMFNNLTDKYKRNSYIDLWELNNNNFDEFNKSQIKFIALIKDSIRKLAHTYEKQKESTKSDHNSRNGHFAYVLLQVIQVGSFAVPILISLFVFEGWSKLWVIIFCIPFISQIVSFIFTIRYFIKYPDGNLFTDGYGDSILAWSILVFVIVALFVYYISLYNSKKNLNNELNNVADQINTIQPLYDKANKL